jgi:hypothetical protein
LPAAIRKTMPAAECWGALTGSGHTLFDNRKAGKSTPIIPTGLRSAGTSWCGFITSLLESSKTVENKGSSNNCLMKCGNESQCPVQLRPTQFQRSRNTRYMEPQTVRTFSEVERRALSNQRESSSKAKTDWVSFMIKLLRAYGGCLGARRR